MKKEIEDINELFLRLEIKQNDTNASNTYIIAQILKIIHDQKGHNLRISKLEKLNNNVKNNSIKAKDSLLIKSKKLNYAPNCNPDGQYELFNIPTEAPKGMITALNLSLLNNIDGKRKLFGKTINYWLATLLFRETKREIEQNENTLILNICNTETGFSFDIKLAKEYSKYFYENLQNGHKALKNYLAKRGIIVK